MTSGSAGTSDVTICPRLSINAGKPLDYHLNLGVKLAPLRDRAPQTAR